MAISCNDSNPCTTDSCDPGDGCQNDAVQNGTVCPGGEQYECMNSQCVCVPNCADKQCGNDGCGGSCGECGNGDKCIDFTCQAPYTCSDILVCALGCNFTQECSTQCYGNASEASKGIFNNLALCIAGVCGFNIDPACYGGAIIGPCAGPFAACQAD